MHSTDTRLNPNPNPNLNLALTRHAAQRMQQRGIKASLLDLLFEHGRETYAHNGALYLSFNQAARRKVQRLLGKAAAQLNLSTYAVLATATPNVITVGHRRGRIQQGR